MAAISAKQINFHLMGYFPITPSTEVAELVDEMKAAGEHDIVMVAADGEHSAGGICFGATGGSGRVFNTTSAQGLLYQLEELPVQSGSRYPMLLDLATRTVSGPLDIHGDHSDVYFALNAGWLIFMAHDPQAVYDLNLIALRVAERAEIRLYRRSWPSTVSSRATKSAESSPLLRTPRFRTGWARWPSR